MHLCTGTEREAQQDRKQKLMALAMNSDESRKAQDHKVVPF